MPIGGALIGAGGSILGSVFGSKGAKGAAKTQADAAKYSADSVRQQFEETRADQQPWLKSGGVALSDLMTGLQPGGQFSTPYSGTFTPPTIAEAETNPGYQFSKEQGEKGILNGQSASGGAFTGGTLKALSGFNQNLAQQDYQQVFSNKLNEFNTNFNAYNTSQNSIFNRLASISGLGQTAATQLGNEGANAANSQANLLTSGAASTAAGQVGAANAWSQGIGGVANNLSGYIQLRNLMGQQPVSYDQAHLPAGQTYNVPYQPPAQDNTYGDFEGGL